MFRKGGAIPHTHKHMEAGWKHKKPRIPGTMSSEGVIQKCEARNDTSNTAKPKPKPKPWTHKQSKDLESLNPDNTHFIKHFIATTQRHI